MVHLSSLGLPEHWRTVASPAWWYWPIFLGVVASLAIWSLAGPLAASAAQLLIRTGLDIVLLRALLAAVWGFGQALLALAASPLIGYSLPLLTLLGVALLAWPPRAQSAAGRV
jgi:hypothetical protein